jgi:molybdate transport system substrate-binding protein
MSWMDGMLRVLPRIVVAVACVRGAHAESRLEVFAAASLTEVVQTLSDAYRKQQPQLSAPRLLFASSSILARQIEAGARADVFISADQEWMDYLADRQLIRRDTRRDLVGNRLVLIAPANSTVTLHIAPGFPLLSALGDERLAMADPDYVPAGKYAQAALTTLGVWPVVAGRLVRAENVRVALTYVARGETPLGIVYATDARADARVKVVDTFPAGAHLAIRYPVAALTGSDARAEDFVRFLASPDAMAIFEHAGFIALSRAR